MNYVGQKMIKDSIHWGEEMLTYQVTFNEGFEKEVDSPSGRAT